MKVAGPLAACPLGL